MPLMVSEQRAVMDKDGNPVVDSDGNPVTETVQRNATLGEVVNAVKSGRFGYKYNDHTVLNTTQKQDGQISKNAFKLQRDYQRGDKSYNLYFNNCTDACQDITQPRTGISLPMDFDPRPNSYFKSLKGYTEQFNRSKNK